MIGRRASYINILPPQSTPSHPPLPVSVLPQHPLQRPLPGQCSLQGELSPLGSTLVCILYNSFECPPFLMHFLTSRVFSRNKARLKTDTVINYRFQKRSVSWIEGLEKGLCLLLPLLCLLSKSGHWFCL